MTTTDTLHTLLHSVGSSAAAASAPAADPLAMTAGSASEARIAQLFRGTRRHGRIHPLQHLIQRHRAERQAADAAAAAAPGTAAAAPGKPTGAAR